jgi:hypothetical protein
MTAHDQHTEARQPTEEREVLDYPNADPNFSAAEADSVAAPRGAGALETEPPPLETQAADRDRQFETQAPQAADRQFEKVPVAAAPLATEDTRQDDTRQDDTRQDDTRQDDTRQDTEMAAHRSAERSEPATDGDLFAADELAGLRARWDNVQAGFVDDPRECVHKADSLVSDVVDQLTSGFSAARARLEEQWARGEQASTEDLRVALTQYREFFQRLLAV